MKTIEKPADLLQRLQGIEVLSHIDPKALQWLIDKSSYLFYEADENIAEPDQEVNHMQIVVEGRYTVRFERNGEFRELGTFGGSHITGVLPFSRMKVARAYLRSLAPTYILALHKDCFTQMVNVSYELTQALVSVMTTRVRDFTGRRFQDEKLMALGKLSAGLAHELNNPASAMVRSAEELYKNIHTTPEKFKSVITMRISPEQTDQINGILFSKLENVNGVDLSLMEREERLDDMVDWMEDRDIDHAEDIAETLVDYGFTDEDLERVEEISEGKGIGTLLWWIESTLSLEKLVTEIQESADRIATLVKSVKSYSHMDRGSAKEPTDIHDGIRSTLIMLKHKLKGKNIQVVKEIDPELPKLKANAGELNQIWTNLIVNAIDAMDQEGTLTIRTYPDREFICVEIADSGKGIPEENLSRIFDPFFTTKKLGEGTGMGLDIVKKIMDQHKARIDVASQPGNTTFKLCFPPESDYPPPKQLSNTFFKLPYNNLKLPSTNLKPPSHYG